MGYSSYLSKARYQRVAALRALVLSKSYDRRVRRKDYTEIALRWFGPLEFIDPSKRGARQAK